MLFYYCCWKTKKNITSLNYFFHIMMEVFIYDHLIFVFQPCILIIKYVKKKNLFGISKSPVDIVVVFHNEEQRMKADIKVEKNRRQRYLIYLDGETVSGQVYIYIYMY